MKLTKKILSLVLAVALVLGSIAVAANAADYDGLAYEGSKLTYTVTADKTEVKPGETVTFSVYMTTNYYTGSAGGLFAIWNAGVFEALGTNYSIKNFGATFKNTVTSPARTASYPSGYAAADYVGFQAIHQLEAGITAPKMLDNELVYEFTFKVLESAQPGAKVTFEIPAGAVKSDALPGMKGMTYMGIGTSSSNPTNTKGYAQTTDVSAASVTLTVVGAAVLGEIVDVTGFDTYVNDTAVVSVEVTGAPEKLTVTTPDGTYNYTRNDATIETIEAGEHWIIEIPVNAEGENACTVTADYGEAGVTEPTAFTVTGITKCNYEALEAAVAKTPAMDAEYYDVDEYAAWAGAKAAGQALLDGDKLDNVGDNQKTINDAAALIESTFAALDARYADLTNLNAAVENCDEPAYAAEYYDADLYAAWEKALADAKAAQQTYASAPATQQGEVDKAEAGLRNAFAALDPSVLDISVLTSAIDDCDEAEYAAEYYDAVEYAAWEKALADAQAGVTTYTGAANTAANQQAVADLAKALRDAFAALDARFVDASAIAEAITAYGAAEYAAEYYDVNEYAAWEAALAAANDADFEGKADTEANRAAVAKIADDLKVAYDALDARFVDASAIANAIAAAVPAYGSEYYDATAYAAFEAALAAAQTADFAGKADTEANRAEVAEIAENLNDAFTALVPQFVSYAKLEAAVETYGEAPEAEFYYTPDSWAAYVDAKAAAVDANTNRPEPLPAASEENQAAVDAYADALEKAYNELAAAESHIISVTPLQEIYDLNDVINLSVLVEGKATKVQLIRGTNATSTYTRTHTSVKSITDNGDGTETWVIARRVYEKDYTEYAKAKFGKVWDTGVYAYDLVCKGDDLSVKSIEVTLDGEVVDTVTRADLPTLTIVTGPAVKKLRLVDPVTGGAISFSSPVSVNEDGTKVWVIVKQYNQIKTYDLDVSVKGSAGWVDSGVDFELNVVKTIESQLPSTDNVEDAILSASVAKTRILRGATQTFTITTDKAAKAVRILKADGSVFKTISASASVEGNVATWTYECSYSSIGERSYTAEALYGNTWIADADSAVNFTVIY